MSALRSRLAWSLVTAVIGIVAATAAWQWRHVAAMQPAEIYGVVSDFTLVDRTGRTLTLRDFLHKISVVDFVYTRCTDACPLQTAQMVPLQARYAGRPGLQLSITVYPGHDDRQTLAAYTQHLGAYPVRRLFLTGPRAVIYRPAVDGCHLAAVAARRPGGLLVDTPAAADGVRTRAGARRPRDQLAHGSHFAIVDRQARIVGYFDSLDGGQLENFRGTLDRWLRRR